jgi:hypothetical protein
VMHIGIICDDVFRTKIVINSVFFFTKVLFTAVILPNFCHPNKNIFLWIIFWQNNSCWFFCRIMSTISSQRVVRQRTEEGQSAFQAKIMDRNVLAERNVVRTDIMVPLLDSIYETIQTYHWEYLYTCACIVLNRLVRLFYANLEVAQDDERGMVLQSTIDGHIITVYPQIISRFLGVPVLDLSVSPSNEVVLPPSMDDLREFFDAVPQAEGRPTNIKIGALAPAHRMLAKIVQHNLWPVARRSDLILKRAQFVYAVHLRLSFYLRKHILGVMLEARDESNTGLPFGCLITQIILQSGINVNGELRMKIQHPLSKQSLMKSNAQLRREDSDDDMPAAMHVAFPDVASSSHTVPPSEPEANYSQIMEALAAIQGGMTTMQQSISSLQLEVRSINKRVEQTHLDLQECLRVHHPNSSDDEDIAAQTVHMLEDV